MKKIVIMLLFVFFLGNEINAMDTTVKYSSFATGIVGLVSLAKQIYDKDYTRKVTLFTAGFLTTSFFGALYSFGLFSSKKNKRPSKLLSCDIENGFPMSLKQIKAAYRKTDCWNNFTIYSNRANISNFNNQVTIQSNGSLTRYCYDLNGLNGEFVWLGDTKKLIHNATGKAITRKDN